MAGEGVIEATVPVDEAWEGGKPGKERTGRRGKREERTRDRILRAVKERVLTGTEKTAQEVRVRDGISE